LGTRITLKTHGFSQNESRKCSARKKTFSPETGLNPAVRRLKTGFAGHGRGPSDAAPLRTGPRNTSIIKETGRESLQLGDFFD
jgi:hypothetical protein